VEVKNKLMALIRRYVPFIVSALVLLTAIVLLYPLFQYYIDPDGTAYLTITRRYATGHWAEAVNGYWGPWGCWLSAILVRFGVALIPASVAVNTAGAVGFLFASQSLFLRFQLPVFHRWVFQLALVVFLSYAVYAQSFDDLWACCFLLLSLRVMLSRHFGSNFLIWVLLGALGCLAYLSKAYAFPFFILNTTVCTFLLMSNRKLKWLRTAAVALAVMLLLSFPWVYALHHKYGLWLTSTSGRLNMSWYLVGHPFYKHDNYNFLVPPYPDSPYYWEDPYTVNGPIPRFWNSWKLAFLQCLRLALNAWKFIFSTFQLSVFFPLLYFFAGFLVILRRSVAIKLELKVLTVSMLLFPLGYFLINFEPRYLWYMLPLILIWSVNLFKYLSFLSPKSAKLQSFILAVSITVVPLVGLVRMVHIGRDDHSIAQQYQAVIGQPFSAVVSQGWETQRIARVAYFSGCQYLHYTGSASAMVRSARAQGVAIVVAWHPLTDAGLELKQSIDGLYCYVVKPGLP
jgi:hypothetical protein